MSKLKKKAAKDLATIDKTELDEVILKYVVKYLCSDTALYNNLSYSWTVEENIEALNEYTEYMFSTLEDGIDAIAEYIAKKFNIEVPIIELSHEIIDYIKHDDSLENEIKTEVNEYIEKVFKKKDDVQKHITYDEHFSPNDICNVDDTIGSELISNESIDIDTRAALFAYIDGKIITGMCRETHTQLLNEYLSDNGNNEFEEKYYRVSEEEIHNESDFDKVAFGHILPGNVYVIDEESLLNVALDEVVRAIEEQCTYEKIYQATDRICLKRLAKIIK